LFPSGWEAIFFFVVVLTFSKLRGKHGIRGADFN